MRNYPVVDAVSIVNPDGSETPSATHPAEVTVQIAWQNAGARPVKISGLTAPTVVPPSIVPGGLEPVAQQPFRGHMFIMTAIGSFKAVSKADDGTVLDTFQTVGLNSDFGEVGFDSLGALVVGRANSSHAHN